MLVVVVAGPDFYTIDAFALHLNLGDEPTGQRRGVVDFAQDRFDKRASNARSPTTSRHRPQKRRGRSRDAGRLINSSTRAEAFEKAEDRGSRGVRS